jgi:hypothetical protein
VAEQTEHRLGSLLPEQLDPDERLGARSRIELCGVLDRLSREAQWALGENFVGAYLLGSFALGHGDESSDVDFLVVTDDEPSTRQERALRELHARFPDSAVAWAQHLEGSYVTRAELRQLNSRRRAWLYVDNGQRQMERSRHDNTVVTRWVMQAHGIVLTGPHPGTLIEPIRPERIQREALHTIEAWSASLQDNPGDISTAWGQPHEVLGMCRFLFSLVTGAVTSKIPAGRWAMAALDPAWRPLIQRAIDDRPDPWGRAQRPADPELLEPTRRFVGYVLHYAQAAAAPRDRS